MTSRFVEKVILGFSLCLLAALPPKGFFGQLDHGGPMLSSRCTSRFVRLERSQAAAQRNTPRLLYFFFTSFFFFFFFLEQRVLFSRALAVGYPFRGEGGGQLCGGASGAGAGAAAELEAPCTSAFVQVEVKGNGWKFFLSVFSPRVARFVFFTPLNE